MKRNKLAEARRFMAKTLKEDGGLYQGYLANVAMLIYDDQMSGIGGGRSSNSPTNLKEVKGCNDMAERLLKLIFD